MKHLIENALSHLEQLNDKEILAAKENSQVVSNELSDSEYSIRC